MSVATTLNSIRYDLRNYGDIDFDIDLMIHYLNRAINILDARLVALNSDQTLTENAVTVLSSGNNSVATPQRCLAVREVWIGQIRKEQLTPKELYYRRRFRTTDAAEPNFWAWVQTNLEFEVTADTDYTLIIYLDVGTADLTKSSTDMPYNGQYDDVLREVVVQMCINKKYKKVSDSDANYIQIFDQVLSMDIINRKFKRKNYRLDF